MQIRFTAVLAIATFLAAPVARAGDAAAPAPPPKGLMPGDAVPAFEAKDLDGQTFSLATARTIVAPDALAAINVAAKAAGIPPTLKGEEPLEKVLGSNDGDKRAAFGSAAGKRWGLVATATSSSEWKTVGDVVKWIEASADAPIVFLCWSHKCPTSKAYEERIVATLASTGARIYGILCNETDAEADAKTYADGKELPLRILSDRDQKITDVLGGRRTPHAFVIDGKNVLRYAGAIDNDSKAEKAEDKRISYLAEAILAIKEGLSVEILVTTPVG